MTKKYPMTEAGKRKLESELRYLQDEKRKKLNDQIKEARGFCDFSEDVSFREMLSERNALEEQIKSLESTLYNAEVIKHEEDRSSDIKLGNTVTFVELPDGDEETYTIVGRIDADPADNKISSESPIANCLLGHKENDEVFIQTPSGKITIKIVRVC